MSFAKRAAAVLAAAVVLALPITGTAYAHPNKGHDHHGHHGHHHHRHGEGHD